MKMITIIIAYNHNLPSLYAITKKTLDDICQGAMMGAHSRQTGVSVMAHHLSNITDDQRQEMQRKAAEKRAAKQQWAKDNLKLEWDDKKHWQELASKHGYRLPVYYEPAKSKFVNRFLKHFGLSQGWYQDVTGFKSGNEEMRKNPKMPAFAQVGFLLEAYNEEI